MFFLFFLLVISHLPCPSLLTWRSHFFLGYVQSNCLFYPRYCIRASSSVLHVDPLHYPSLSLTIKIFSVLLKHHIFRSSPNTSTSIFLVIKSLSHTMQCYKSNTWLLYLIDEINNPVVTLKTNGHQWYWRHEYLDFLKVEFDSMFC